MQKNVHTAAVLTITLIPQFSQEEHTPLGLSEKINTLVIT